MMVETELGAARLATVITGVSLSIEALRALQEAHLRLLRDDYRLAETQPMRDYYADAMRCASARISALTDALRVVDSVLLPG